MSFAVNIQNVLTAAITGNLNLPTKDLNTIYQQSVATFFKEGHLQASIQTVQSVATDLLIRHKINDVDIYYNKKYLIRNIQTAQTNFNGYWSSYKPWVQQQRRMITQRRCNTIHVNLNHIIQPQVDTYNPNESSAITTTNALNIWHSKLLTSITLSKHCRVHYGSCGNGKEIGNSNNSHRFVEAMLSNSLPDQTNKTIWWLVGMFLNDTYMPMTTKNDGNINPTFVSNANGQEYYGCDIIVLCFAICVLYSVLWNINKLRTIQVEINKLEQKYKKKKNQPWIRTYRTKISPYLEKISSIIGITARKLMDCIYESTQRIQTITPEFHSCKIIQARTKQTKRHSTGGRAASYRERSYYNEQHKLQKKKVTAPLRKISRKRRIDCNDFLPFKKQKKLY